MNAINLKKRRCPNCLEPIEEAKFGPDGSLTCEACEKPIVAVTSQAEAQITPARTSFSSTIQPFGRGIMNPYSYEDGD